MYNLFACVLSNYSYDTFLCIAISGRDRFKKTKGAILTSVSILTTGFDEPTVQSVILNRATNSLTLYHQMIGRGARRLPQKKRFTVIDLGNNTDRFGEWDAPMDWKYIFDHPDEFNAGLHGHSDFDNHTIPAQLRAKFPNSLEVGFDIVSAYEQAVATGAKVKTVLRDSIRQHALMCADNADTISAAMELASLLDKEVQWRVRQYNTPNAWIRLQRTIPNGYRKTIKPNYALLPKELCNADLGHN